MAVFWPGEARKADPGKDHHVGPGAWFGPVCLRRRVEPAFDFNRCPPRDNEFVRGGSYDVDDYYDTSNNHHDDG